jgi:hypothetical protein
LRYQSLMPWVYSNSCLFALAWLMALHVPIWSQNFRPMPSAPDFSGSISGKVTHPILNTRMATMIRATRVGPRPWTSPEIAASLEGDFTIRGLPPGDFVLCARVPNRDVVDPCFWGSGSSARTIHVTSGQAVTGQTLALERGRRLDITVRDPGKLLQEPLKGLGLPRSQFLHLMLHGPQGSRPVFLLSTRPEPDGQGYEATIPARDQVRLRVASKGLQVVDATGRDFLAAGTESILDGSLGVGPIKLEFRIPGRSGK